MVQPLEAVMMYLLKEAIEEDGILKGIILLYEMLVRPISPHVLQYWSNESFSLLGSGTDGLGHIPSINPVGILLPPFSLNPSRMFGSVKPSYVSCSRVAELGPLVEAVAPPPQEPPCLWWDWLCCLCGGGIPCLLWDRLLHLVCFWPWSRPRVSLHFLEIAPWLLLMYLYSIPTEEREAISCSNSSNFFLRVSKRVPHLLDRVVKVFSAHTCWMFGVQGLSCNVIGCSDLTGTLILLEGATGLRLTAGNPPSGKGATDPSQSGLGRQCKC